jgi:8-oxo-dGTP pyrophosphatase MutT (NUDIX family)
MTQRNNLIRASGCLFLAIDTGRVLLQQRSGDASHPRTWAFFGGKAKPKERPVQTLLRECEEELGVVPSVNKIYPLNQFVSPDKRFEYNTFIIAVFEEFLPILNNESDGYCWVKIGNWPRPLHPGVKAQLYNKEIVTKIKTTLENASEDGLNWLDTL